MVDDAITRHTERTLVRPDVDDDAGPAAIEVLAPSFEAFFNEARGPMVRLAFVLTGSIAQAEEAVQESFVRVYERWSTIDDPGAYLRRAVVNRCTSWHRHRAVVRRSEPSVARAESYLDTPHESDELAAALAQLPRRRRAVVALRFYEQLDLADIAATLGVSVGTVKSTLNRALAQLRGILG
jgi:RNA polymerase sigma-70 factor (sigma-E family)